MNANELRIGNILNGGIVVQSIDDCGVNTGMQNSCLLSNLHPIPITAEILEKARFVKIKEGDNLNDGIYEIGKRFDFIFIKKDGLLFLPNGHSIINVWYKYLHQLQNLIFALTGEELEINLNEKALS